MKTTGYVFFTSLALILSVFIWGWVFAVEMNTDRPGMNYDDYSMSIADPKYCEKECTEDPVCKAWTYVKQGIQGELAHCYLKDNVPPPKPNNCCISGIKAPTLYQHSQPIGKSIPKQLQPQPTEHAIQKTKPPPSKEFNNIDLPDLIVVNLSVIESSCEIKFSVKNIGTAGVTKNFKVSLGLITDPNQLIYSFPPNNLKFPGSRETYVFPNLSIRLGDDHIIKVNYDGAVKEKDYTNNTLKKTLPDCKPTW